MRIEQAKVAIVTRDEVGAICFCSRRIRLGLGEPLAQGNQWCDVEDPHKDLTRRGKWQGLQFCGGDILCRDLGSGKLDFTKRRLCGSCIRRVTTHQEYDHSAGQELARKQQSEPHEIILVTITARKSRS